MHKGIVRCILQSHRAELLNGLLNPINIQQIPFHKIAIQKTEAEILR